MIASNRPNRGIDGVSVIIVSKLETSVIREKFIGVGGGGIPCYAMCCHGVNMFSNTWRYLTRQSQRVQQVL